jgi:antitoxin PrlF
VSTVTRLTTKHQTTVPLEVRRALGLEAGDHVEFRVEGTSVTLHKVDRQLTDDLVFGLVQTHAMRDWDTPEDEAFRDFEALGHRFGAVPRLSRATRPSTGLPGRLDRRLPSGAPRVLRRDDDASPQHARRWFGA